MMDERKRQALGLGLSILIAIPAMILAAEVGPLRVFWIAVATGAAAGWGLSKLSMPDPVGGLLFIIVLIGVSLGPAVFVPGWWPSGPLVVFLLGGIISLAAKGLRAPPNDPRSAARAREDDGSGEEK